MEHVVESSFMASWQPNINRVREGRDQVEGQKPFISLI
jgi:hypothetical protein